MRGFEPNLRYLLTANIRLSTSNIFFIFASYLLRAPPSGAARFPHRKHTVFERRTGLEPATSTLARWYSKPIELSPQTQIFIRPSSCTPAREVVTICNLTVPCTRSILKTHMERKTGLEPATYNLEGYRSTN